MMNQPKPKENTPTEYLFRLVTPEHTFPLHPNDVLTLLRIFNFDPPLAADALKRGHSLFFQPMFLEAYPSTGNILDPPLNSRASPRDSKTVEEVEFEDGIIIV